MRRIIVIIIAAAISFSLAACSGNEKTYREMEPQVTQMKSICELATMKCYYHNVAKYSENDVEGILWWKKSRNFWVEYAGIVTIGIDTSLVKIEVDGENVTITIPPAKVLGCKVDEKTLTKDSFIVATNSAKVEAEHQTEAFKNAQAKMQEAVSGDTVLLANAQQRAQKLLEDYVNNIGSYVGKSYHIKWIYLEGAEELSGMEADKSAGTDAQGSD